MPLHGKDDVKKAMRKTKIAANKKLRAVYFVGLRNIMIGTPVDEGRARNNWFLTHGIPFSLSGRDGDSSGNGSARSLDSMPVNVLAKKVYFTNNLPYIETLEYGGFPNPVDKGTWNKRSKSYEIRSINGFSKQAPSGWVRAALIKMRAKIRLL